jgi:uracil-DNA glycosylase
MTASVRCAPPDNRPTPAEVARCAAWLDEEFALLPRVRVVVALGKLAFDRVLLQLAGRGAELPSPRPKFAHGAAVHLAARVHVGADVAVGGGVTIGGAAARRGRAFPVVLASYHPSRQNTQTGRLSPEMLRHVFARAREIAAG